MHVILGGPFLYRLSALCGVTETQEHLSFLRHHRLESDQGRIEERSAATMMEVAHDARFTKRIGGLRSAHAGESGVDLYRCHAQSSRSHRYAGREFEVGTDCFPLGSRCPRPRQTTYAS